MKISEFVKKYDTAVKAKKDVSAMLAKHKTTDYVSYETKMAEAKNIVNMSSYTIKDDGTKVFHLNTPGRYLFFCMKLVELYTDLEVDWGKGLVSDFNLLNQRSLFNSVAELIGEVEYKEFNTVLQMTTDDEMENFRSFAGYLDTKIDTFTTLLSALEDIIPKPTEEEISE